MGKAAVALLVNQMESVAVYPEELLFEPELVVRGSTGPAATRPHHRGLASTGRPSQVPRPADPADRAFGTRKLQLVEQVKQDLYWRRLCASVPGPASGPGVREQAGLAGASPVPQALPQQVQERPGRHAGDRCRAAQRPPASDRSGRGHGAHRAVRKPGDARVPAPDDVDEPAAVRVPAAGRMGPAVSRAPQRRCLTRGAGSRSRVTSVSDSRRSGISRQRRYGRRSRRAGVIATMSPRASSG